MPLFKHSLSVTSPDGTRDCGCVVVELVKHSIWGQRLNITCRSLKILSYSHETYATIRPFVKLIPTSSDCNTAHLSRPHEQDAKSRFVWLFPSDWAMGSKVARQRLQIEPLLPPSLATTARICVVAVPVTAHCSRKGKRRPAVSPDRGMEWRVKEREGKGWSEEELKQVGKERWGGERSASLQTHKINQIGTLWFGLCRVSGKNKRKPRGKQFFCH